MAADRSRTTHLRGWTSGILFSAYVFVLLTYWIAGAQAYLRGAQGLSRFLGLAYFPILLLPVIGRGTLAGVLVRSDVWWWWFALQMLLGAATMFAFPRDLRKRPKPRRRHDAMIAAGAMSRVPRA